MQKTVLSISLAMCVTLSARVQAENTAAANTAPSSVHDELDAIGKGLLGSWNCKGEAAQSPYPAHPFTATIKISRELDGYWYEVNYVERKSAENAKPIETKELISYDIASKKLRRVIADNGGGITNMSSKGWEGNKLVWFGDWIVAGRKTPIRQVWTRNGEREIERKVDMKVGEKVVELSRATCKR